MTTWTQTRMVACEECPACQWARYAAFVAGKADGERTRCEVWSRVMGYHRPVTSFNIGKRAEWRERKMFREPKEERG